MLCFATCKEVAAFVLKIEDSTTDGMLNVDFETTRYVRIQRFFASHPLGQNSAKSRDDFLKLAASLDLSAIAGVRLYLDLVRLNATFRVGTSLQSISRASDPVKDLERLLKATDTIAKFSARTLDNNSQQNFRIASRWLEVELTAWLHSQRPNSKSMGEQNRFLDTKAAFGFDETVYGEGNQHIDYASHIVLNRWLRMNVLMAKLIPKLIAKRERIEKSETVDADGTKLRDYYPWGGGRSEIVDLVGIKLPALYTKYCGKSFALDNPNDRISAVNQGLKFVVDCMKIMGLRSLTKKTIRDHWHKAHGGNGEKA